MSSQIYKLLKTRHVDFIGAAFKHGQRFDGVQYGPQELRKCGLYEVFQKNNWTFTDKGDLRIEDISFDTNVDFSKYKHGNLIDNPLVVGNYNKNLYKLVKESADKRNFVLTLGGDHSVGLGSILALKASYPSLKVIWVDAHADINTPECTISKFYHGCPLSHITGIANGKDLPGFEWINGKLEFKDLVHIGLRNIDHGEKQILRDYNIKHYCMEEVTYKGIGKVMTEIFEYFKKNHDKNDCDYPIHLSFDVDGIDYQFMKQTGTICRGGLTDREGHHIIRRIVETGKLVSMDLVEFNPLLGDEYAKKERINTHGDFDYIKGTDSACLSLELIQSALGYRLCL